MRALAASWSAGKNSVRGSEAEGGGGSHRAFILFFRLPASPNTLKVRPPAPPSFAHARESDVWAACLARLGERGLLAMTHLDPYVRLGARTFGYDLKNTIQGLRWRTLRRAGSSLMRS